MFRLLSLPLLLSLALTFAAAETPPANDEQVLRNAIQTNQYQDADDIWFLSNTYPHPIIGKQELYGRISQLDRANVERQDHPERIVVSPDGDMAYDYGHADQTWVDTKTGENHKIHAAYLRVWKKVNGEWRVAAETARPDDAQSGSETPTSR
jgi:ketosteroid isomerase-like protein